VWRGAADRCGPVACVCVRVYARVLVLSNLYIHIYDTYSTYTLQYMTYTYTAHSS